MVPKCHREANNILGYDTKLKLITNIGVTKTFELPDRDSNSVGADITARLRQRRVVDGKCRNETNAATLLWITTLAHIGC